MEFNEALKYVRNLSPEDRDELSSLFLEDPVRALWAPFQGPQAGAYYSDADELFYGGAAGGGKTGLIIGLALTQHQRTLILRRESTQLRGLIDDLARILKSRDGLNTQAGQWRVPPAIAPVKDQIIEFGGVPNPGDEERHQGIPHDLLAFDEATQFPEYIIDYLSTWCRSIEEGQRTRVLLTSNPPTPSTQQGSRGQASSGGLWIVRRYAPWLDPQYRDPCGLGPAAPGELRWFVTLDGVEQEWPDPVPFTHPRPDGSLEVVRPKSRTFIPAKVQDNPYLASTDYASTLQKLPEPLRSAMLYGDFSISLTDRPAQLFPTAWIRASFARHEVMARANPPPTAVPQTCLGVDVSRGGVDDTIVFPRYQHYYASPIVIPAAQATDGPAVAARLLEHRRSNSTIVVDANGVGASVYDHLKHNTDLHDDNSLVAYVGSVASKRRDRSGKYGFANLRSEAYWRLRESLDPATDTPIALPQDDRLMQELLAHTFEEQSGKLKVIAKKDVVKVLGRSPDRSDALVMAHWYNDPDDPVVQTAQDARQRRLEDARGLTNPNSAKLPWSPSWGDKQLPYPQRY